MDFVTKGLCFLSVPHDEKGRVIPGETSDQISDFHTVNRGTGCRSEARHGFDHNNILGAVKGRDPLLENGPQTSREVQAGPAASADRVGPAKSASKK